jgi:hypothetical protein
MKIQRILALILLCALLAFPQGSTSLLSGTVTDQQGGVVPNATVKVTNVGTNQVFTTITSGKGEWSLPSMLPSEYVVTVSSPGF